MRFSWQKDLSVRVGFSGESIRIVFSSRVWIYGKWIGCTVSELRLSEPVMCEKPVYMWFDDAEELWEVECADRSVFRRFNHGFVRSGHGLVGVAKITIDRHIPITL
jgi:hypothetical protein